jgi:TRAP transporter TAXI family solute receptor
VKTIASVLLACFSAVSVASATDLGLITAGEKGTYHQFGLDLQRLVRPSGINLTVHPSKGSVDNILALSRQRGVQMGIVQSDVLGFLANEPGNPTLTRVARSLRLVFPLYNEEVHVLGRREIGDFDQLAGARVAIGLEGSGTYLTARLLFKLAEVVPGELVPIDAQEALGQLKAGRIDAMIYVAGYPVRLLKNDVTFRDGLALIPISSKSILESYDAVEIPAHAYDWQPTPIRTAAVKAVLVSYDVRGRDCDGVGRVAQQIATGLDWLMRHGHPKWRQVDLDYQLKGWEPSDCVRRLVGKGPARAASGFTAGTDPGAGTLKGASRKD